MAKEFKINKTTKKIIDYDDKEISIEEYNRLYKRRQHPTWVRLQELYDKFSGCQTDVSLTDRERLEELKKSETISSKL